MFCSSATISALLFPLISQMVYLGMCLPTFLVFLFLVGLIHAHLSEHRCERDGPNKCEESRLARDGLRSRHVSLGDLGLARVDSHGLAARSLSLLVRRMQDIVQCQGADGPNKEYCDQFVLLKDSDENKREKGGPLCPSCQHYAAAEKYKLR